MGDNRANPYHVHHGHFARKHSLLGDGRRGVSIYIHEKELGICFVQMRPSMGAFGMRAISYTVAGKITGGGGRGNGVD